MSDDGFVRVYRRVLDNTVFRDQSEAMVFVWMVMRASWQPATVRYKDRLISLERGQLALSVRDLANAFDRSKDWANRFLERLANRDMIATASATGVNIITLCKYADYQAVKQGAATPTEREPRQDRDRTATQNKEGNEVKEGTLEASASKGGARKAAGFPAPEGVEDGSWQVFASQRKKRLTQIAYDRILKTLADGKQAGWPPGELVDKAIERGWETVFVPKDERNGQHRQFGSGSGGKVDGFALALRRAEQATAPDRGASYDDG